MVSFCQLQMYLDLLLLFIVSFCCSVKLFFIVAIGNEFSAIFDVH